MSKRLGQALVILFVVGLMVCFSSLLFLLIFFNFSQIPPTWVIASIAGCAVLQITAFLGGVAFKQRIWPAVLMFACGAATAWVGVIGPATLFGMPITVLGNPEGVNQLLYAATLPVTVVGVGVGIAYFVLGIACLVLDAFAIQKRRNAAPVPLAPLAPLAEPPVELPESAEPVETLSAQDKQVIYSHVVKALGVPDDDESDEADTLEKIAPPVEEPVDIVETVMETEETSQTENQLIEAKELESLAEDTIQTENALSEPVESALSLPNTESGAPSAADDIEAADTAMQNIGAEDILPTESGQTEGLSQQEPATPETSGTANTAPETPCVAVSHETAPKNKSIFARVAAFFRAEQPPEAETPENAPKTEDAVQPETQSFSASPLPPAVPTPAVPIPLAEVDAEAPAELSIEQPKDSAPEQTSPDIPPSPSGSQADSAENTAGFTPDSSISSAASAIKDSSETDDAPSNIAAPPPMEEPAFVAQNRDELLAQWGKLPLEPIPAGALGVTLETERLRIVRLDMAAFASLLQSVDEMERATGLAPSGEKLDENTLEAFEALYQKALSDPANTKWYAVWLITSKSENKLMGSAGFKNLPGTNGEVELNYGIHAARRGKGYGPEAAAALCRWGMMQREVQSVLAETGPDDSEAVKFLEEAGMQPVQTATGGRFWRMAE